MKITLHESSASLDPGANCKEPWMSLDNYIEEVSYELRRSFFGVEIEHDELEGGPSWTLSDLTLDQELDRHLIEQDIKDITERVFANGSFWV
jgi:hypothetical protein